jgi:tetratricopeptide (TPR) repeat protein
MSGRAFVSRFSPNRTDTKVLEEIFVQRHALAKTWFERLRDSAITEAKHHLLAVGPRGCGKSHLVAILAARLQNDPQVAEKLCIAWLPEDETTPSFWKFLLRILRALNARYGDEFPPPPRDELEDKEDDHRSRTLTDYLLKRLDHRTLLVVVENLDDVMRGLKSEGQKRWRAFLQEHPIVFTLATSQQLTEDVSDRDRPFFNFFQVEHLEPLTADDALLLLQKIATLSSDAVLSAFLRSPAGRARVRAIRHIAGGGHRVFIILSEFATQENLDKLVTAFEELLDELTPYYQERLRWLPEQQREIVEHLCRQARTVPVKDIAAQLYLSEQTAGAQLKSLKEKGYVRSATVGRESRYELAEPLMRLCVEVKQSVREPIRLIVDFLRIWYDRERFALICEPLDHDSDSRKYIDVLSRGYDQKGLGPVDEALQHDLVEATESKKVEQTIRISEEITSTTNVQSLCAQAGFSLLNFGRWNEALAAFGRACEMDPNDSMMWLAKGYVLLQLRRHREAIEVLDRGLALCPVPVAKIFLGMKGYLLESANRPAEALKAFEDLIEYDPESWHNWNNKAFVLNSLGRFREAIEACDRALALKGDQDLPYPLYNRGRAKLGLGQVSDAVEDLRKAVELNDKLANAWEGLAEAQIAAGDWGAAEKTLVKRFSLSRGSEYEGRSWHLPDVIIAVFAGAVDHRVWEHRVSRLIDIAVCELMQRNHNDNRPNPVTLVGTSLVQSLARPYYACATGDSLVVWVQVWKNALTDCPAFALSVRLFEVGMRFVQTRDERVLLDLLQEERSILREVFRLDEEAQR